MNGGLGKINRYLLAGASVIGLLAIGAQEAKAQDLKSIQSQIDSLQSMVQSQQATIKALQKQVQDAKAQASTAQTTADSAKGSDLDLKVKWKGAPELSSGDGKFKMKIRGRLETDYNHVDQDTAITSFPDVSATELRRARLGVEGILYYDWKYVVEVDFADDLVVMKDAYLQYQGFKIDNTPVWIRAGNFNTFTAFEQENSDRFVDTMERAAFINAWEIDRQIGFGVTYYGEHLGLAAGVFGERFPSSNGTTNLLFNGFVGDEDLTLAARAFVLPIHREVNGVPEVLFFGASVRNREPATTSNSSPTETERVGLTSIWPMPRSSQDGLAMRTCTGVSRLPPYGDRSLYKANMRASMSICQAEPPFPATAVRSSGYTEPLYRCSRSGLYRLVCRGKLVLRRPQKLQRRGQVGAANRQQSDVPR